MASKFIVLAAFAAAAQAGLIGAPLASPLLASRLASPIGIGSPLLAQQYGSPLLAQQYGSPLLAQQIGSPLLAPRLASPLLAQQIGSPLLTSRLASPLVSSQLLAPRLAAPIGSSLLAPRVAVAAPIAKTIVPAGIDTDYDPNPSYSYAYDVQDALTGDSKNQQESRQGDVVQGSYSLTEPDGTRRTVDYTADPINGFNAVVRREPLAVVQKAVVAAPALTRIAAPLYG